MAPPAFPARQLQRQLRQALLEARMGLVDPDPTLPSADRRDLAARWVDEVMTHLGPTRLASPRFWEAFDAAFQGAFHVLDALDHAQDATRDLAMAPEP